MTESSSLKLQGIFITFRCTRMCVQEVKSMEVVDILELNSNAVNGLVQTNLSKAESCLRSAVGLLHRTLYARDDDCSAGIEKTDRSVPSFFDEKWAKIETVDVPFEDVDETIMCPYEKAFVVIPRRMVLVDIDEANSPDFLIQLTPVLFYNLALFYHWSACRVAENRQKNLRRALRFYELALTTDSAEAELVLMATLSNMIAIQSYFFDTKGVKESLNALIDCLDCADRSDEATVPFLATAHFFAKQKILVAAAA